MWTYAAPVADMLHLMTRVLDAPASWRQIPAFDDVDADTAAQVLAQAARFAGERLAPLNGPGDLAGCRWSPEGVTTPPGFREAYRAFVDGGWPALACAPDAGGQGLPQLLGAALAEMLAGANHAWAMYPGLLHGAYEVIRAHAVPELRERYLAKLVAGEWLATMCLTEPQAGSDLAQVRTRAETDDGVAPANGVPLRVSGDKIFISGGDHDLSANIVHLVLCRLAGAPPGTRGLSLALVPKILPDGGRNRVWCDAIEKKMGIKGSATCQMRFEAAQGWLVGEPHRGLAAMFLMMNAARLHVGLQGLGHLEAATQNAWAYAAERLQMRAAARPPQPAPAGDADPIAWHPAVRRNLMAQRARTDGCRLLAYWIALLLDEAEHHPDAERRARAAGFVTLLTPVAKAFFTDLGHRGADEALQVWGGYGYVHDYGIEQAVRDSRIAMIYEGTNEIQAIDLTQRKLLDDGGTRARSLIAELGAEVEACRADPALADFGAALAGQLDAWRDALALLLEGRAADPEWPLRVADDMMAGIGHALLAWAWARIARTALQPDVAPLPGARAPAQWLAAARFGVQWLLPQAAVHWQRVARREADLPWLAA
jgi:alkylation response protein AidB-like acyl-CoA dehydrogenase